MAQIEDRILARLRTSGLLISKPFPEQHPWSFGVQIGKPTSTKGNFIPHYKGLCAGVESDAPAVVLFHKYGEWHVLAQDHKPTPGLGDFENRWATLDEAVDDIVDFYLGNPARMALKAAAKQAVGERNAANQDKD